MSYQDSNPERRNLSLLSLGIIVFYLAEGQLVSEQVRLQVVNVVFSKPEILVGTVWVLLFWFCYRYWLVHQGSWRKDYRLEMTKDDGVAKIAYPLIKRRFKLDEGSAGSPFPNRHWLRYAEKGNQLVYKYIYNKENGQQQSTVWEDFGRVDRLMIASCSLWLFFRRPTLSTYFIPYLLFFWAISLGLVHHL